MKKVLVWALLLWSTITYGEELRGGLLEKGSSRERVLELNRFYGYGKRFEIFRALIGEESSNNRFELNSFTSGFSYVFELENWVSFELGVKVYVIDEEVEEEEYLEEEAWQHSLYASIGYRF